MPESLHPLLTDPIALLWLVLGLLLIAVLLLIWLGLRGRNGGSHDALVRIEARLGDQLALAGALEQRLAQAEHAAADQGQRMREELRALLAGQHASTLQRQARLQQALHDTLRTGMQAVQAQVLDALARNARSIGEQVEALTKITDRRLQEIGGQVDQRLSEGFARTTATFADVVRRLALIDEAQKKITELSTNVVSLQEVLADKRSRGAFGEVQLAGLVRNVLPEAHFALQHRLSNERIADCMLFLPAPSGNLAIDAKFPLDAFRAMTDFELGETDRKLAQRRFRQDVRKHIMDIAGRYIVPGETGDGALMFIPAEAVFAEIQAHYPDLVELAHRSRVWLVSPTTLWAVLNTARAVLKDAAFREQVDVIRQHLTLLGQDFGRFRERLDNLARHIDQAHQDVQSVHTSARRISERFDRIERVELPPAQLPDDPAPEAPSSQKND